MVSIHRRNSRSSTVVFCTHSLIVIIIIIIIRGKEKREKKHTRNGKQTLLLEDGRAKPLAHVAVLRNFRYIT